jgi:hypothetical protein
MGIAPPEGHRNWECKATTFDAKTPAVAEDGAGTKLEEGAEGGGEGNIIRTQYIEKGGKHMLVLSGPRSGIKLCATWNWSRTRDGTCPVENCKFTHECSLCLDRSHRAIDCEAREYLPLPMPGMAGRPESLVPVDVDECFALVHGLGAGKKEDGVPKQLVIASPSPDGTPSPAAVLTV